MDWRARFKNPLFWAQIFLTIAATIGGYFGLTGADMDTWSKVGQTLLEAIKNPYVCFMILVSVWGVITNPTTPGLTDGKKIKAVQDD